MAKREEEQVDEIILMLRRIAYAVERVARDTVLTGTSTCDACGCTLVSPKHDTCPVCNHSSE